MGQLFLISGPGGKKSQKRPAGRDEHDEPRREPAISACHVIPLT
jgi:hypothetical protein